MNENLFIGEDHDFFFRLKQKYKDIKIFFFKKTYVFHEDRAVQYYFLQRFCYGLNVFTSKNTKTKKILSCLPACCIMFIFYFFLNLSSENFFLFIAFLLIVISFLFILKLKNIFSKI